MIPIIPVGVGMTEFSLASLSIRAAAVFKEPILSWTGEVPSRFFQVVYRSLNEILYIQPSDLIAPAGTSLGDCSAALRIFGGNSTLTLKPNAVIAEFPSIEPDRIGFANTVILQGYEALMKEFSELEIGSIESNVGYHLKLKDHAQVHDILTSDNQTALQKRAQNLRDVVLEPAIRLRLVSKDGKWSSRVSLEKSDLIENGIFLHREVIVSDLAGYESTQQKFSLIERIDFMVFELFGLESKPQDNDAN